jgi:hypothetical protein
VSAHTGADLRTWLQSRQKKFEAAIHKKKGNNKKVTKKETITKKKPARPRFLDMLTETPKSVPYTFSKVRESPAIFSMNVKYYIGVLYRRIFFGTVFFFAV